MRIITHAVIDAAPWNTRTEAAMGMWSSQLLIAKTAMAWIVRLAVISAITAKRVRHVLMFTRAVLADIDGAGIRIVAMGVHLATPILPYMHTGAI